MEKRDKWEELPPNTPKAAKLNFLNDSNEGFHPVCVIVES